VTIEHVHNFRPRSDGELVCACGRVDMAASLREPSYRPPTPGVSQNWRGDMKRIYGGGDQP